MKKVYKKPTVIVEDFSLSTSIANGCDVKIDTANSGNCGLDFGAKVIFIETVAGCTPPYYGVDDGQYNGICYHVPMSNNDMFNS